jgi:hypothetical protein
MNIKEISIEESKLIIETYLPIGKYIVIENDICVGIDNESGCAWTEEFKTKEKCISWLNGEFEIGDECQDED